jgi:hypothetical protein
MGDENVCLNKIIHIEEKSTTCLQANKSGWRGGRAGGFTSSQEELRGANEESILYVRQNGRKRRKLIKTCTN